MYKYHRIPKSTKTTYGYALKNQDTNKVLKYGETINPKTRYTKKYLAKNNAYMEVLTSGFKREVHYWQHNMIGSL